MPQTQKDLGITDIRGAHKNIDDLQVFGNGDSFQLICKASSEAAGWMKSTKALEIPGLGVVIQVTTQQGSNVAEALVFVPGAYVELDVENEQVVGRRILSSNQPDSY